MTDTLFEQFGGTYTKQGDYLLPNLTLPAEEETGYIGVSGHLQVKKGYYYVVLSYNDNTGKRRVKYFSTGLPQKGNKRKAEFIGFMASPQRLAHPRTEKYKELIREFKYNRRRERENEQRRQKRKMMKAST